MNEHKVKQRVRNQKAADWYEFRTDDEGKQYKYYLVPSIKREVDKVFTYAYENLGIKQTGLAHLCGYSNYKLFVDYFVKGTKPITYHQMMKLWTGVGFIHKVEADVDVCTVHRHNNLLFVERNFYPKFALTMNLDDMLDYSIKILDNMNHVRNRSRYIWSYLLDSLQTHYGSPAIFVEKNIARLKHDFDHKFATRNAAIFYNYYETYENKDIPKHLQEPKKESEVSDFDINVEED